MTKNCDDVFEGGKMNLTRLRSSCNNTECFCTSTQQTDCYDSLNKGSIAMIVIGIIILVVAIGVLIWLWVDRKVELMLAFGKAVEE